jgi:hypothetical protein
MNMNYGTPILDIDQHKKLRDLDAYEKKTFSSGCAGLYSEKVHLTKDSKAMNDMVILEIVQPHAKSHRYGTIIVPEAHSINAQALRGRVVSIGPDVTINLKPGDIVLYDRFSAFYNPPTTPGTLVITRVENVICLTDIEDLEEIAAVEEQAK